MRAHDELVARLARRRAERLGGLSDEAYAELVLAVRADATPFVDDDEARAFQMVGLALDANDLARGEEDALDDDAYQTARAKRIARLRSSCAAALELDDGCVDARLLLALTTSDDDNERLAALLALAERVERERGPIPTGGDAWDDVFARPQLRVAAAVSRTCLDTARYALGRDWCERLLAACPADELGARFTMALACARLEDEEGFERLDARFGRRGNAWSHLGRVLLAYKLDRLGAARRSLKGFASLCEGGAYALLRPVYIDTYLPDRPHAEAGGLEEATLAVHEADPIIADTPDFVAWAAEQPGFQGQAHAFADEHGLDW